MVLHRPVELARVTGHVRLARFQANFSFLFGTCFADPDHAAALEAKRVLIEDKFDHLAALELETSTQPESFFRRIKDEAGEPPLVAVQVDDQAGASLQHHTLRAAGFGNRRAGHSFTPWSGSSDGTP